MTTEECLVYSAKSSIFTLIKMRGIGKCQFLYFPRKWAGKARKRGGLAQMCGYRRRKTAPQASCEMGDRWG